MSSPFVAEIRIFACNFAPTGWALCNGQLLPISQNTALFSLLGTFYGGDGKSTFALPNLQGSVPIGKGQGPGLTDRVLGEQAGEAALTLITTEMPAHSHVAMVTSTPGTATASASSQLAMAAAGGGKGSAGNVVNFYRSNAPNANLSPFALGVAGGSQPHNNMMPYLALTFCIALQGVFPPRG